MESPEHRGASVRTLRSTRLAKRYGLLVGLAAATVSLNVPGFTWPYTFSTVLVLVAFAMTLLAAKHNFVLTSKLIAFDAAFLLLISWRLLTEIFNAADISHEPSFGSIAELATVYLASWIARAWIGDLADLVAFARGMLWPSVVVSALGVLQIAGVQAINEFLLEYTSSPGLESRTERGVEIRATSLIGHWTALGGYLACMTALACMILIIVQRNERRLSPSAIVLLAVTLVGQASTLTFATIAISLVICLVALFALGARPVLIFVVVAASMLGWVLFGSQLEDRISLQSSASNYTNDWAWLPESLSYRMWIWTHETIPSIFERPVTGWGTGVYSFDWTIRPELLSWTSPESEWMRTAMMAGLVGLLLQAFLLLTVWSSILRPARPALGRALLPISTLVTVLVIASFIHPHLTNRGVPLALWAICGAIAATRSFEPHQGEFISVKSPRSFHA